VPVIPVKTGIQCFQALLDAGSAIPDPGSSPEQALIRDRHDGTSGFMDGNYLATRFAM
jgi:hypothetical protein